MFTIKVKRIKPNSDIYKKNLEVLLKKDPELVERLDAVVSTDRFLVSLNADGKTFNLFMPEVNQHYYKKDNPMFDVKEQLEGLKLRNTRIAMFLGFGLGYEIIYYFSKMLKKQMTTISFLIEKDLELFKIALTLTDFTQILKSPSVHLLIGMNEDDMFLKIRTILSEGNQFFLGKAMKPVYYHTAMVLNKEFYLNTIRLFKDALVRQLGYVGNSCEDSLDGLRNMFVNINEITQYPGVKNFYNLTPNKPAIIISSGPSLEKNIDLLKDLGDKAVLISANSTMRAIKPYGIKPHIVCSHERTDLTKACFETLEEEDMKETILAGCPVIPKEAYDIYKGPRMVVYRKFDHFLWLEIDKGMMLIRESSSNMAFSIAEAMGCNPIILVGQDLAFGEGSEASHISTSMSGSHQDVHYKRKESYTKGNYTEQVRTNETWLGIKQSFELDIANYKGKCINATEGGAYIHGTELMTLKEAIDRYMTEPFQPKKILFDKLNEFSSEEAIREQNHVLELIDDSLINLQNVIDKCLEGLKHHDENKEHMLSIMRKQDVLTSDERTQVNTFYNQTIEQKNAIKDDSKDFQLLLMHVVQPFYVHFEIGMYQVPDKYEDIDQAKAEMALHHADWFHKIMELTKLVMIEMEEAKERMLNVGEE